MAKNEHHPIRNGIAATVVGGLILSIILSDSVRSFVFLIFDKILRAASWVWETTVSNYSLPGWLIFLFALLSLPTIGRLLVGMLGKNRSPHLAYTQDHLYGVIWRWKWYNNAIINLWCFCPVCDAELIYDDRTHAGILDHNNITDFICERCGSIKGSVPGHKDYSLGLIEREIHRRIRTNEYKEIVESTTKA